MRFPLVKQPSAIIPLILSFAALSLVLGHAAIFGIVHESDEGTAAHIFQILMVAQIPIVALFAIKWLPRAPRKTLKVLALQVGVMLAAIVAVLLFT